MGRETYAYGRGGANGVFFLVFFAVVTFGGILLATGSAAGIEARGLPLGPAGATFAYITVAIAGGWLALSEAKGVMRSRRDQSPIELRPRAIVAPSSPAGRKLVELTYDGITDMRVETASGEPWLHIRHRDGKLAICGAAMESRAAFDRMLTSLELRVTLARPV